MNNADWFSLVSMMYLAKVTPNSVSAWLGGAFAVISFVVRFV